MSRPKSKVLWRLVIALGFGSLLAAACGGSPTPECSEDTDCGSGEVCEPSGPSCGPSICVPGCRVDAQCGPGLVCNVVQCFTCPCPGSCGAP